jgi:hypothetical protein
MIYLYIRFNRNSKRFAYFRADDDTKIDPIVAETWLQLGVAKICTVRTFKIIKTIGANMAEIRSCRELHLS